MAITSGLSSSKRLLQESPNGILNSLDELLNIVKIWESLNVSPMLIDSNLRVDNHERRESERRPC